MNKANAPSTLQKRQAPYTTPDPGSESAKLHRSSSSIPAVNEEGGEESVEENDEQVDDDLPEDEDVFYNGDGLDGEVFDEDDEEDRAFVSEIERNLIQRDEIEEIIVDAHAAFSDHKEGDKFLCEMLYTLFCCIVGDNIGQTKKTDLNEYHQRLAVDFMNLKENFQLRKPFMDHILKWFPQNKLPRYFLHYIDEISHRPPTSTYLDLMRKKSKWKGATDDMVTTCFFGSQIESVFKDAKNIIQKIQTKWVPANELKSGRNTYALHKYLRRFFYEQYDIHEKAKSSAQRHASYQRTKLKKYR